MSTFGKKVTSAVLTSALVLTTAGSTAGVSAALMDNVTAANTLADAMVIVDQSTNPAAYRLNDTIQRKEALKVMMNLSDKTVSTGTCTSPFSDIADSDWACKYASAALDAGFIAANDNFRPDDNVSKIEALKMVMQARGIAKSANADWKAAYVEAAVSADIAETFSDYNTSSTRGLMFVWAAEAIAEEDEMDGLCELLGTCEDTEESTTEEVETEESTTEESTVSGDDNLVVSINAETPSDGLAQADTARVALLKFDVKAGSEDVILNEATLEFIGLGDRTLLKDVSIYNQNGEKVSKTKSFKDITREISFDKDIVVEAGTTMTLTVAGKIADTTGTINATFGIKLINIKASSNVMGEDIVGALLVPAVFNNVALLKVKEDKAAGDITVGEEEVLAGFELEETNDNEDITLETVTFHVEGSADEDDLSDLSLYADGEVIASNLTVNSDEEIVAGSLNYTIAADDKVSFELKGTVSGSVGDNLDITFESTDDIYALGSTSNMPVKISTIIATATDIDISDLRDIEGSEINVTFDKAEADEAKPESDDNLIGTLKVTANADGYTLNTITVTVSDAADAALVIDDLKLDDSSYDALDAATGKYTFTDIVLNKGEEKTLELTMDVEKETTPASLNGKNLSFSIEISEVEDEDNDVKYTTSTELNKVLSTNSFSSKSIDINTASFTLTNTQVNDRQLVLGNGIETVIYKGKISVGDADSVEINDFDLIKGTGHTVTEDLDKVIASATLNIGGQTFDADIDADSVDFSSVNAVIAAGSDNVEVLVTAILKDNDSVTNGQVINLKTSFAATDLEDTDGNDVVNTTIDAATVNPVKTELLDKGTLKIAVVNEADTDDNLENTILAGESNVTLAELEIEAEYEDMKVEELTFKVAGIDHSNTFKTVKLVNTKNNSVIADGAVITFDGTDTLITFKNDFTVSDSDDLINAELVADLNNITGTGDETTAIAGDSIVSVIAPAATDVRGINSSDDITTDTSASVNSETVSIVPTILNFAVVESLSTGTAQIKITANSGNNTVGTNDQMPEVVLTALTPTDLATGTDYKIYKDGNAAGQQTTFAALTAAERTFDTEVTYVFVPQTTDGTKSYTMVLSGDVATYDVQDSNAVSVSAGLKTILDSDISVGTKSY